MSLGCSHTSLVVAYPKRLTTTKHRAEPLYQAGLHHEQDTVRRVARRTPGPVCSPCAKHSRACSSGPKIKQATGNTGCRYSCRQFIVTMQLLPAECHLKPCCDCATGENRIRNLLLKTYLKIRTYILGSRELEGARVFICATGDLYSPLRASGPQNLPLVGSEVAFSPELSSIRLRTQCSRGPGSASWT